MKIKIKNWKLRLPEAVKLQEMAKEGGSYAYHPYLRLRKIPLSIKITLNTQKNLVHTQTKLKYIFIKFKLCI